MLRLILCLVFGCAQLSLAPGANAAVSAGEAANGTSAGRILVQQQSTTGSAATPSINAQLEEVARLRKQIAGFYGGPQEMAVVPLLAREFFLGEQIIRTARTGATDAQMHALIDYLNVDSDVLFSMMARRPSDAALVKLGLSYANARRARFAREQFQESFAWKTSVAHEQPDLWRRLRQAQNRFSDLSILPSFLGHPRPDLIEQQAAVIEDLEKRLADNGGLRRAVQLNSTSDILADIGVDQLVANVNFGKVLIVYVAYDQLLRPVPGGGIVRGPSRYLAIVGHADAPLAAVDLGPSAEIDALVKAFLEQFKTPPLSRNAPFDKGPAQSLFRILIAPLRGYFAYQGVDYRKTLMIVPDAALLTIPLMALVDEGTFMIDEYGLQLLDMPEEANLLQRSNLEPSTRLVAFANPDVPPAAHSLQRLAEADREANQIAALWLEGQREVVAHGAATPEALESKAPVAGILHIASHGVFAATVVGPTDPRTLTPQSIGTDRTGLMASSLARSAIVLAPTQGTDESGFFSALAVLSLDLSHTQLVVLSACESGRGDRERGEGIYGLRRSFLAAGAETVVSSLWRVDDAATREFMVNFYRNLFQGEGRGSALQHAAAFTRLSHPHPYYWAAFVISGNLGGLRLPPAN
jgi:CHAT domain-containing protein